MWLLQAKSGRKAPGRRDVYLYKQEENYFSFGDMDVRQHRTQSDGAWPIVAHGHKGKIGKAVSESFIFHL